MVDQKDINPETGLPHYCLQADKITEMHSDVKQLRSDTAYIKGQVAGLDKHLGAQDQRIQSLEGAQRRTTVGGFVLGLLLGVRTFFWPSSN